MPFVARCSFWSVFSFALRLFCPSLLLVLVFETFFLKNQNGHMPLVLFWLLGLVFVDVSI